MIKKAHIKNFKSIKDLELDCARVNVLIGDPNTGKSNILEALGMMSMIHKQTGVNAINALKDFVRAEEVRELFSNKIVDDPISVELNSNYGIDILTVNFISGEFEFICSDLTNNRKTIEVHLDKEFRNNRGPKLNFFQALPIRFYKFKRRTEFPSNEIDYLNPPDGDNLLRIIQSRKVIKEFVLDLFQQYSYKYQAFEDENKIYFNIDFKGEFIPLPLHLLSDTLLRIIFYFSAIELGKDTTVLLEEPESHVFPFYNKFLAERIALYNKNQFFIATHNPTFLANFIEQTPDKELKVFITYYEDYQTKVFPLSGKYLRMVYKIFGIGIFGNLTKIVKGLDKIIEKEEKEAGL